MPEQPEITINVGLEPTEEAKSFIRRVVLETMQELFAENQWMEQRAQEAVETTMQNAVRQARLTSRTVR